MALLCFKPLELLFLLPEMFSPSYVCISISFPLKHPRWGKSEEALGSPGVRVTDIYKLSGMGDGNQSGIFCKSKKCFSPWSICQSSGCFFHSLNHHTNVCCSLLCGFFVVVNLIKGKVMVTVFLPCLTYIYILTK